MELREIATPFFMPKTFHTEHVGNRCRGVEHIKRILITCHYLANKRVQNPLDLWSLVPEGSQETCLSYAEHEHLRTSLRVQRYDNPPKLH